MIDTYSAMILAIIKGQEAIIGPIAWEQALGVAGLKLDKVNAAVVVTSQDQKHVVDELVLKFRDFFGQAAIEVCKEAARKVSKDMTSEQIPESLQ